MLHFTNRSDLPAPLSMYCVCRGVLDHLAFGRAEFYVPSSIPCSKFDCLWFAFKCLYLVLVV